MPYTINMATTFGNRTSRLDIRLTAEQRALIERAVSLKGLHIDAVDRAALLEAAQREIEEASSLKLENEAFDAFCARLMSLFPPKWLSSCRGNLNGHEWC